MPTEATFTEQGVDVVLISEGHFSPYPRERLYDGITYRVGRLISDFLLVPYPVARAGGVALLRLQVAAAMWT